ncbi:MAG: hypothetical protein NC396_04235 [Bacteroides sp.]|nr:hypothetical protein [Bacteroides sp.]MCM1085568.1 hypothetical protein [Bacteroides sp.]
MKSKIVLLLLSLCASAVSAQTLPSVLDEIEYPHTVDTLLLRRMEHRLAKQSEGYRILIFSQSGNRSKNAAIEAKSTFDLVYPECKSYILFEEPYFKVKAGNFTNRVEAGFFLRSIKADYPYAFIVKDVLDVRNYLGIGD